MLWFFENDSILNKALDGLSSVCAISEPASSKNNEILEINVLQKCTLHAICTQIAELRIFLNTHGQ